MNYNNTNFNESKTPLTTLQLQEVYDPSAPRKHSALALRDLIKILKKELTIEGTVDEVIDICCKKLDVPSC